MMVTTSSGKALTWRFHEHCKSAIWEAHQKLEDEMFQRAFFGYDKVLTHRGRVMYKIDQDLVGLGYQGPDAYLRDENGNPVPETVHKVDKKAQLSCLEVAPSRTRGASTRRSTLRARVACLSSVT